MLGSLGKARVQSLIRTGASHAHQAPTITSLETKETYMHNQDTDELTERSRRIPVRRIIQRVRCYEGIVIRRFMLIDSLPKRVIGDDIHFTIRCILEFNADPFRVTQLAYIVKEFQLH